MTITANTKIAKLIKENPETLEAIVAISPKFVKLRNPVLRKLIAGRTSISMASKIGGCSVEEFFDKLEPLGFKVDKSIAASDGTIEGKPLPGFMKEIDERKIITLDVRPVIESGKDPLNIIMSKVKGLQQGHVLKIINTFEPTPLIQLLGKQGFESYVETVGDEIVHTYFHRNSDADLKLESPTHSSSQGWDETLNQFNGRLVIVDVRDLEMPLPMHTILEALESLREGAALFVYHKRIPVFLLPELEDRKFSYRIKEVSDAEVHLLIYRG